MSPAIRGFVVALAVSGIAAAAEPARDPAEPTHQGVALAVKVGSHLGREVKVLIDTPVLKLTLVTLHSGLEREPHSTPEPVTIQSLLGTGTIWVGDVPERLEPGRLVMLAAGVVHSAVPDSNGDLVLLVHHLKGGRHEKAR